MYTVFLTCKIMSYNFYHYFVYCNSSPCSYKTCFLLSVDNFEPKLKQFQELKLEKTSFIVVSLDEQELFSSSHLDQSLRVLEAAQSIGTDSALLEASLLQTLGHAYWQSGNISQALEYMEHNLTVNINNKDERA